MTNWVARLPSTGHGRGRALRKEPRARRVTAGPQRSRRSEAVTPRAKGPFCRFLLAQGLEIGSGRGDTARAWNGEALRAQVLRFPKPGAERRRSGRSGSALLAEPPALPRGLDRAGAVPARRQEAPEIGKHGSQGLSQPTAQRVPAHAALVATSIAPPGASHGPHSPIEAGERQHRRHRTDAERARTLRARVSKPTLVVNDAPVSGPGSR